MIKFKIVVFFLLVGMGVCAQTTTVKNQKQRLKGENVDGFAVDLEGIKANVNSSLSHYLKTIGKLKFLSTDPMVVTDPIINGNLYVKKSLYAFVTENGSVVSVWLGIKPSEWDSKDVETINKQLERMAKEFGVRFYRERMQAQIDETQQAIDAVDKQTNRFINQGKDLTNKLANNELNRIKLERELEANKLEHTALKIKIQNNKKAQDSIANVAVQIKKVKGAQVEKLGKIN